MKYMGSKARHAKEMLPIILKDHTPDMWYVEPFVGGANMISKVNVNIAPKRVGFDSNEYLIEFFKALQSGYKPPLNINLNLYNHIKQNKNLYDKATVACVGFCFTYAAKWFGGFIGNTQDVVCSGRDRLGESYRAVEKARKEVFGIKFEHKSVFDIDFSHFGKATIYCDPPYAGTTKYKDEFDHEKFYDWCILRHKEGHRVFISEYWMPEDRFECVWSKEVNNSLTKDTGSKKGVEKLFVVKVEG